LKLVHLQFKHHCLIRYDHLSTFHQVVPNQHQHGKLRKYMLNSCFYPIEACLADNNPAEHATDPPNANPTERPRRPDLSTFFSTLSQITPDSSVPRTREHAVPVPHEVSAAFRTLADAFGVMRHDSEGSDSELLDSLIESLMSSAERPPREVEGVDDEYIANLERVSIKKVAKDADCPICGNPFSDDPHPLIVRLPCHSTHIFDLECVRPWLRLRGTCPLDRVDLAKRERDRKQKHLEEIKKNAKPEDEEEEWDGLYG
jgi:Ring finger domain